MEGLKSESAKKAVKKMLFYYISALIEEGNEDPKRIAATELGEMINLSEEQVEFVINSTNIGVSNFLKDLTDIVLLIEKGDDKSRSIAVKMIEAIRDKAADTIKEMGLDYVNEN
jgi:hypothetical protein